ncbi:uncharacterized protein HMPREF1541_05957 [Cyphellophora europaea CBS 101466]|uniref:FAD dependent oxidoreductase domain-containing protein n=1 Tax=Cyphellophora europaea (strain CBS 101466) TaxID=1220924 RepID=W2RT88_CYPE1|nr:uncharacterized protein HMPREF1541_05957 [Cyphellophora europaea CBS 101466]ETN39731.1 hypothetical protein HMPREF1541_05957 [Cyphellophora europaea CBS 101466]
MSPPDPIIVIGAGVLGLSVAHTLQTRHPSTPLLIIATELPTDPQSHYTPDYASPWAGAHYRPIPATTPQLASERTLALSTATTMQRLASTHHPSTTGLALLPAIEYLERPGPGELALRTGDTYASPTDNFRILATSELPPDVQWGCAYDTYCVNTPLYLRWLLRECQKRGARVLRHRLPNAKAAFGAAEKLGFPGARTVVNCSGRNFDGDAKVGIIRGQTVLVRREFDKTVTRQCGDGSWSFLIPRPGGGGTIVGGTKEVGDWEGEVRVETRERLLRRARECFPEFAHGLGAEEVVRDVVGRRPWREGGLRIESEDVGGGKTVVHGYGAGGRGFELSWGVAEHVVGLVEEGGRLKASL